MATPMEGVVSFETIENRAGDADQGDLLVRIAVNGEEEEQSQLPHRIFVGGDYFICFAHYLEARKGFRSDASLARVLGVHRSRVTRWKSGVEAPDEENLQLLLRLSVVVRELLPIYDRDVIEDWLISKGGEEKSPMDLLREGNLAEVLRLINASASGAYV